MSPLIEEEAGTCTSVHPHNGYYAGDFSGQPLPLVDHVLVRRP